MSLDNNGEPLPQGYGRSFDYKRRNYAVYAYQAPQMRKFFPPIEHLVETGMSEEIKNWVEETIEGLKKEELNMKLANRGLGGTYICYDKSGKSVAVFKPWDEEAKAPNNPHSDQRANSSTGLVEGTKAGKGAAREIAAYLLDHPTASVRREGFNGQLMGFCGVPPTVSVYCMYEILNYGQENLKGPVGKDKFGSLQMFMESCGDCDDDLVGVLDENDLQKMCLLDIRFANKDRHFGNILYNEEVNGQLRLIPIDHGSCFPENILLAQNGTSPKGNFNPEIIEYINSLDSKEDIDLLIHNKFTMNNKVARTLHISTMLLQEGVKQGLTPFEIGHLMCKLPPEGDHEVDSSVSKAILMVVGEKNFKKVSVLEKIMADSIEQLVDDNLEEDNEEIVRKVEEESQLEGLSMTKQQVEGALLLIVFDKLRSTVAEYAEWLGLLRQ